MLNLPALWSRMKHNICKDKTIDFESALNHQKLIEDSSKIRVRTMLVNNSLYRNTKIAVSDGHQNVTFVLDTDLC